MTSAAADRLRPTTRFVLCLGVALTIGTGVGLWLLPSKTESYWAWVIRAPLSAAFLGAGYASAAASLGLALRFGRWTLARSSVVSALVLTTVAFVATARHGDTFLLGRGDPLPRAVAWVWLVVYLALPPLAAVAFLLQELGARAGDVERSLPLARASIAALALAGAAVAVPAVLLLAGWEPLLTAWPWPLAPLPDELIGGWLLTAAVTLCWAATRERDWARTRASAAGAAVFVILLLLAAVRLRSGFEHGIAVAIYVASLVGFLALLAAVAVAEEQRARRADTAYGDRT